MRWRRPARFAWGVLSLFAVESLVIALAVVPAAAFWMWHFSWTFVAHSARPFVLALAFVPAYLLFAASLMLLSALVTRLLGWRTPPSAETRVADYEWPLLDWARYLASIHIVRLFAGAVSRSTPVWTWYMRLNGARIGRGVWINSLAIMDHWLLDIGERSVIGSDAHVSAHIVERGILRTAPIHIGRDVTIGIGSVVEIGAQIGDGAVVGALSVVPKFARLEAGGTYVGAPVHRIDGALPPPTEARRVPVR